MADEKDTKASSKSMRGHIFGKDMYYKDFSRLFKAGWQFETTPLTEQYGVEHLLQDKPADTRLIAGIDEAGFVSFAPWPEDKQVNLRAVVSFVPPAEVEAKAEAAVSS